VNCSEHVSEISTLVIVENRLVNILRESRLSSKEFALLRVVAGISKLSADKKRQEAQSLQSSKPILIAIFQPKRRSKEPLRNQKRTVCASLFAHLEWGSEKNWMTFLHYERA